MTDICHDRAYQAVLADDFDAMIDIGRYSKRHDRFDSLIARTDDHFWDPRDKHYIDYDIPWDIDKQLILPLQIFPELQSELIREFDAETITALANENARWMLSSILHGEQAALIICSQLCNRLLDPGAQEYAANQAREEARHVAAFSRYIAVRWGTPCPVGDALGTLLRDLVHTPDIFRKLVGMQILVEGLAMGLFAVLFATTHDILLKRIMQLVLADEAFHHKFGKTWAENTMPRASQDERSAVEDWAAHCFEELYLNLNHVGQRRAIYDRFGVDYAALQDSLAAGQTPDSCTESSHGDSTIFRALVGNLVRAGIVTSRTRHRYARWLDAGMPVREADPLDMVGAMIAEQGAAFLQSVKQQRRQRRGRSNR